MSSTWSKPDPDGSAPRSPLGPIGIATLALLSIASLVTGLIWNGGSRNADASCPPQTNDPCIVYSGGLPDTAGCILAHRVDKTVILWSFQRSGGTVLALSESDGQGPWGTTEVDTAGASASGFSLLLPADRRPVVALCGARGLEIATRSGGAGQPFTLAHVDGSSREAASPAIAQTATGLALTYCDVSRRCLNYSERSGKSWKTVVVDRAHAANGTALLATGSARAIAYYDPDHGDLRVARRRNGVWSSWTVDSAGDVGLRPSMVGDAAAGRLGIAYFDRSHRSLKYAWFQGGKWSVRTIETKCDAGGSCSLTAYGRSVTDSIGIAYRNTSDDRLEYAEKLGSWTHVVLDPAPGSGVAVSCEATPLSGGLVRFAYVRKSRDLCYQEKATRLAAERH